jgi:hypothetical protein
MVNKKVARSLLEKEVRDTAYQLIHADYLDEGLTNDSAYSEWRETLDKAFSLVSEFAEKHKIEIG